MQDNQMTINQLDQSHDVTQKVQEACNLIQNNQNSKALEIFQRLTTESKIQYTLTPISTSGIENAEQNGASTPGK